MNATVVPARVRAFVIISLTVVLQVGYFVRSIRAVQISDSHLVRQVGRLSHGVNTHDTLQAVIASVMALSPPPDIIIATGDLADDGADATYARVRSLLLKTRIPTYVLPGNHDDVEGMRRSLQGQSIHFESAARLGCWDFAFVNSQVVGEGYGRVDAHEMTKLKRNLLRSGERPTLVALHHAPLPKCPSAGCQLVNAAEFLDLLAGFPGVKAVIAGHTHATYEEKNEHILLLTAPSTFAQAWHAQTADDQGDFWSTHRLDGSMQGFRVLDLLPGGEVHSEVHWI